MPGFTPDEGETLIANLIFKNADADRGTDLALVLFTNASPGETITAATLAEPSGDGYARIDLVDANWTVSGDTASYALQTFTANETWVGSVQGYAIVTKGTTPRIVAIEVDAAGPYTFNENDTYDVTPNITVS